MVWCQGKTHQDLFVSVQTNDSNGAEKESERWSKILSGGKCWQTRERRHITYANTFYELNLCLLQTWHIERRRWNSSISVAWSIENINLNLLRFWRLNMFESKLHLRLINVWFIAFFSYFQRVIETGGKVRSATDPLGKRRPPVRLCSDRGGQSFHKFGYCFTMFHSCFQNGPSLYSWLTDCLTRVTARFVIGLAGCTEIAAEQQMFVWCGMFFLGNDSGS